MPYTNIDKLGEQYLKFAKKTWVGTAAFEQWIGHCCWRLKVFNAAAHEMTDPETGFKYYAEVTDSVVLELVAINVFEERPREVFVFTLGKDGSWVADYPSRYRSEGMPYDWAEHFVNLLLAYERYQTAVNEVNLGRRTPIK